MKRLGNLIHGLAIACAALFGMATSASAAAILFNTDSANTKFISTGTLSLNSLQGAAATLNFLPDATNSASPGNVNYGIFRLTCATCTTQALGGGAIFDPFTFDLVITDVSSGGVGVFVGSSSGGKVFTDASSISVSWIPIQLGPGTNNAQSGTFGSSFFTISAATLIVNPTSGDDVGQTTVQGTLSTAPEPATYGMVGAALIGLALFRRKRAHAS